MDNLLSARLQIDILRIQIACAAAKEYDAPWLEKSESVMRDATGKFASKGSASGGKEEESGDKLPFQIDKETEIPAGEDIKAYTDAANEMFSGEGNPLSGLIKVPSVILDNINKILADPNIKKAEADFQEALDALIEKTVSTYKEAIESPEAKTVGAAISASIPTIALLSSVLAPQLILKNCMKHPLGFTLISGTAGLYAAYKANEAMDANGEDNEYLKFGIDLAIAASSFLLLHKVSKSWEPASKIIQRVNKNVAEAGGDTIDKQINKLADFYIASIEDIKRGTATKTNSLNYAVESMGRLMASKTLQILPTQYLPFVNEYRANYVQAAKKAKELAEEMDWVPDRKTIKAGFPESGEGTADQISIIVGGYDRDRKGSLSRAKEFLEADDTFKNHHVSVVDNTKMNLPEVYDDTPLLKIKGKTVLSKDDLSWTGTLLKSVFSSGMNEQAIEVAARAYAYWLKNPDKSINLIGHSAGGMVTHDAAEILQKMGIPMKQLKVANLGSPYWGITKKVCDSVTFSSQNDPLMSKVLARDPVTINSVTDHVNYLTNPSLRRSLKSFLDGEKIEIDKVSAEDLMKLKQKAIRRARAYDRAITSKVKKDAAKAAGT